jgi:hypothetical protein
LTGWHTTASRWRRQQQQRDTAAAAILVPYYGSAVLQHFLWRRGGDMVSILGPAYQHLILCTTLCELLLSAGHTYVESLCPHLMAQCMPSGAPVTWGYTDTSCIC